MEKQRKRIRRIFWAIVIVGGVAVGVLSAEQELEKTAFRLVELVCCLAVFIAGVGMDLYWHRKMQKRLEEIWQILLEEKDADRYIQELDELFEGVKQSNLRACYSINLSVAYAEKKEYEKGLHCLYEINPDKLRGQMKAAYWANRSFFCFHVGKTEEGRNILKEQATLFSKYKDHRFTAETLYILSVLEQMSLGHWQEAEILLAQAREKWENDGNREYFDGLAEICCDGKAEGGINCESELG